MSIFTSGVSLYDLAGLSTGNYSALTISGGQLYLSGVLFQPGTGGGGGGVPSVNGITSAVTITGGTGIDVVVAGSTITVNNNAGPNTINGVLTGFNGEPIIISGNFLDVLTIESYTPSNQTSLNIVNLSSGSSAAGCNIVLRAYNTGAQKEAYIQYLPYTVLNINSAGDLLQLIGQGTQINLITGCVQMSGPVIVGSWQASPISTGYGGTSANTISQANQNLTPQTVPVTGSFGTGIINFASGSSFYLTLTGNCTAVLTGAVDGQVSTVTIYNPSTYTVNWQPSGANLKWAGALLPIMTTGNHYDVYTFYYNQIINQNSGVYFGSYIQNF